MYITGNTRCTAAIQPGNWLTGYITGENSMIRKTITCVANAAISGFGAECAIR